jgi:hypothetical protein
VTRYEGSITAIPGWDDPNVTDRLFEKGALLYEEYKSRWVNILQWTGLVACFFGMAVGFVLLGWYDHVGNGDWGFLGFTILIGGMCVFFGVVYIISAIKDMPFKVYEGGVTLPTVPFRDGLDGRETFVPASDIIKVTSKTIYLPKSGPVAFYVFHRTGGDNFLVRAKDRRTVTPLLRRVLKCPVDGPK